MSGFRAHVVLAACLLLYAGPNVLAQQASSFEQLQVLVKPNDTVVVTEFSGSRMRGRIAALSPSSLRLIVDGMPRDLLPADVLEITQRRADSLANGAIIGAIAGGALGTVGSIIVCATESDCGRWVAIGISTWAALGTGVGVGVDALITRQQTIYRAPPRSSTGRVRFVPFYPEAVAESAFPCRFEWEDVEIPGQVQGHLCRLTIYNDAHVVHRGNKTRPL